MPNMWEKHALKKRARDANRTIAVYTRNATSRFHNRESSFLSAINSISLSASMVLDPDNTTRITRLKEEATKALEEYGFVPDDLPFALFYKGDSILSPFGCNHDIIIKCIGLIQLASAVPLLVNILEWGSLSKDISEVFGMFGPQVDFCTRGYYVLWALAEIGDKSAVPSIRRGVKTEYGSLPSGLVPLAKMGCHEESDQLVQALRTHPNSDLLSTIIEYRLYMPELLPLISSLAQSSKDFNVAHNARLILTEAGYKRK